MIQIALILLGLCLVGDAVRCRLRWDSPVMEPVVFWAEGILGGCYLLWGLCLSVADRFAVLRFLQGFGVVGSLFFWGLMGFAVLYPRFPFVRKADGTERVLLVVGAPVWQGKGTPNLRSRTDSAAKWMARYPDTLAVLTGGKGSPQTEAEIMARELAGHGIARERMILEKASETTDENFIASGKVLKDLGFSTEQPIAVVTNEFHVYRLGFYARRNGYSNLRYIIAKTPAEVRFLWYLREVIVIIRFWLTGK